MKIKFKKMTDFDFNNFIQTASLNFADDKVKNGSWKEENALEQSKAAFESLLPEKKRNKEQFP